VYHILVPKGNRIAKDFEKDLKKHLTNYKNYAILKMFLRETK